MFEIYEIKFCFVLLGVSVSLLAFIWRRLLSPFLFVILSVCRLLLCASRVRRWRFSFEFDDFYVKSIYPRFCRWLLDFVDFFSVLFTFVFADWCVNLQASFASGMSPLVLLANAWFGGLLLWAIAFRAGEIGLRAGEIRAPRTLERVIFTSVDRPSHEWSRVMGT